jgi:hypothetical protein
VTFDLKVVASREDWAAYHAIRERVLWEARGRRGYDRTHPDEQKSIGSSASRPSPTRPAIRVCSWRGRCEFRGGRPASRRLLDAV